MNVATNSPILRECFVLGSLEVNTYLLSAGTHACVIDPADLDTALLRRLERWSWASLTVFLTHGHADHIPAVDEIRERFGAKVYCSKEDSAFLADADLNLSSTLGAGFTIKPPDHLLADGDSFAVGPHVGRVIALPGHTPGGLALYIGGMVFTGDTLFAGSVGRSDFPQGDGALLLRVIRERLFTLPDDVRVYPGHGLYTTIGEEKFSNPFFQGSRGLSWLTY